MKTSLFTTLALLLAQTALFAAGFVNETQHLLTSAGDFDGDGDQDIAVLHRASGVVSIGIRQANGAITFRVPVATGVPNATSMAVGHLLSSTRDTLAITGPDANRVQLVNASVDSLHAMVSSHPAAGPRLLAALDIPGIGSSGLEDMMLAAGWPGQLPIESRRMGNSGLGSFTASAPGFFNAELRGWNPITLTRGGPVRLGFMEEAQPNTLFRVAEPTAASLFLPATTQAPTGTFIYGQFDLAESDFFFYTPASLSVTARRIQPSGTAFYGPLTFNFPSPVLQLVRLDDAVRDRVLIISYDGTSAVYDYDGASGFTLVEEVDLLGETEQASTAIALGGGSFMLLHGDSAHEAPTAFSVFQKDGAGYLGIQTNIPLPKLDEAPGINGNVFFFAGTPMRDDNPRLVGMWSVGDWSSSLTLGGSPQVSGELFQNATSGLGGLFNRPITPLPSGTLGALANQFMPDISVSNLHAAPAVLGSTSAGISFSPETATRHRQAVQVVITASDPAATLLFRTSSSEAFDLYPGPFWLFTDTTVEAYAQMPGGARTPVARAHYIFDTSVTPEKQDSDGDGVPDFVERGKGLDPTAGADTDEDGFSDLDEILAGISPTDANQHPDPDTRPATAAQITVNVTPLPLDGTTNLLAYAQQDVPVEVHDVGGILLGAADTAPGASPTASITIDPIAAQQRLLVISTPAHFDILTGDADKRRGRELIGLIPVPDAPVVEPVFVFNSSAPIGNEANRWRDAYAAALAAVQHDLVQVNLDVDDVLAFCLVEKRLGYIGSFRGLGGSVDPLSLTTFRESELPPSFGVPMSSEVLLSLERPIEGSPPEFSPAIRVRELLAEVNTLVANTGNVPGMTAMKKVAREIYRISSALHNASPETYPPAFTTLRKFVHMGFLDSAYQAVANVTTQELSDANTYGFSFAFNSAANRPVVSLTLRATGAASADGRTLVTSLSGVTTYELLDARGTPYELPEAFLLPQGSQIVVTAYNDLGPTLTPRPLEVLAVSLSVIPIPSVNDTDGNLLADDWEQLFFGHLGNDAFASPDGSGYSLLQQSLYGTDPTSDDSLPAEPIVTFEFADIVPGSSRDPVTGEYTLFFQWPTAYLEAFDFVIQESSTLSGFIARPATITHLGGGLHRALIPGTTETRVFYRAAVRLR